MGAVLVDVAAVENDDAVGGLGLGEAVGNDDRGPPPDRGVYGRIKRATGAGVGGGLIEHHDGWVGQQHAGEGELLDAGVIEVMTEDRVEAVGQVSCPVGADCVQCFPQGLVGGAGVGQAQVVGKGSGEQVGVLGDQQHRPPAVVPGFGRGHSADEDLTRGGGEDSGDELGEGRFPGPGDSDEHGGGALSDVEVDASEGVGNGGLISVGQGSDADAGVGDL